MKRAALGAVFVLLVVLVASAGAVRPPGWAIRDLGTLPAPFDAGSEATAINAHGVVIGWSSAGNGEQRAFVWRNGVMQELPGFGVWTQANAIADDGDVVGESERQQHGRAVLWRDGKLVDLGTLGGSFSVALAVNDNGQVVGNSTTAAGVQHAFLWQRGTMSDLGTLGGTRSEAVAINDAGQVIGTSMTASGSEHGFLWQHGTMTDLGSLRGEDSAAAAIDAHGEIVGDVHPRDLDPDHAVLWRRGQLLDIGSFGSRVKQAIAINARGQILVSTFIPDVHAFLWRDGRSIEIGRRYTAARALNDSGWVVGTALFRKGGPQIPFVWHAGRITALPTLAGAGPPTSAAYQINDAGWIVGRSYAPSGDRAVLWTPAR